MDLILTLNDDEKLALKLEADKKKVDKSVLKIVRQTDICLFCNLQDLFTKYEFDEKDIL